MNKKSQTADKGWLSSLGVGQGLTFPHHNETIVLRNVTRILGGTVVNMVINRRVLCKSANFSLGFYKIRLVLFCTVRRDCYHCELFLFSLIFTAFTSSSRSVLRINS